VLLARDARKVVQILFPRMNAKVAQERKNPLFLARKVEAKNQ